MSVETASIPSQLDATSPLDSDLIAEGAAQIRLVKSILATDFASIDVPLTATATSLNSVGITQPATDSSTKVASTANVDAKILNASLSSTLPTQAANQGKSLKTNATSAFWQFAAFEGYSAKSSNYVLAATDANTLIDCTGTLTLTIPSLATLQRFNCIIRNAGTGDINISCAATVDGLTSYIMYQNEVRLLHCDGSSYRTIILTPFYAKYTASSSFIKPPGYSIFEGLLWGGGGGGGSDAVAGGGGGGGACVRFHLIASALSTSNAYVQGAGGAAASSGGNSTFGGVTSYGGAAGSATTGGSGGGWNSSRGPLPGRDASSATDSSFGGGAGDSGAGNPAGNSAYGGAGGGAGATASSIGGSSIYGGAGGGGRLTSTSVRAGGTSIFGGNGGASINGVGTDGSIPAGGGGAGTTGGAGARGELRIWGVV